MKKDMKILHEVGEYTLLHLPNNRCTPFVWAWGFNKASGNWNQGHYYGDVVTAVTNPPKGVELA